MQNFISYIHCAIFKEQKQASKIYDFVMIALLNTFVFNFIEKLIVSQN